MEAIELRAYRFLFEIETMTGVGATFYLLATACTFCEGNTFVIEWVIAFLFLANLHRILERLVCTLQTSGHVF